jgi:tetratricopeptide (TPR) repeat protein
MPELPDAIHAEVLRLCEQGDEFAQKNLFDQALSRFRQAWDLLPGPRYQWEAAEWLLATIGDFEFQRGDFAAARVALMDVVKFIDTAKGNPFIRLRLGQCLYEAGEETEAANWLGPAFAMEGLALFGAEDPKYIKFVKSKLQPPPGGWPKGW